MESNEITLALPEGQSFQDFVKSLNVRDSMMRKAGWKSKYFEYPKSSFVIGSFFEIDLQDDRFVLSYGQRQFLTITPAEGGIDVYFNDRNGRIRPDEVTDAADLADKIRAVCLSEDNINSLRVATLNGCEVLNVIEDSRVDEKIPICFVDTSRKDVILALCDKFHTFSTQSPSQYEDVRLKLTKYFPKFTSRSTGAPFTAYSLLFDGQKIHTFDWNEALSQSRPKRKSLADSADRVAQLCAELSKDNRQVRILVDELKQCFSGPELDPQKANDTVLTLRSYLNVTTPTVYAADERRTAEVMGNIEKVFDVLNGMQKTLRGSKRDVMRELQTALAPVQTELVCSAMKDNGCEYAFNVFFEQAANIQMGRNSIVLLDQGEPVIAIYQDCTGQINVTDRYGWLRQPLPSYGCWSKAEEFLNNGTEAGLKAGIDLVRAEFASRVLSPKNRIEAAEDIGRFLARTELLCRAEEAGVSNQVTMAIIDQREGRDRRSLQEISDSYSLGSLDNRQNQDIIQKYDEGKIKMHI